MVAARRWRYARGSIHRLRETSEGMEMSALLAIDPGTTKSGWVIFENGHVSNSGVSDNDAILTLVKQWGPDDDLAIEMIAGMGMAVGQTTFDTCVWIGRFQQAYARPEAVRFVRRHAVKLHLCGNARAKDANIRQALLDIFPATGGGKTPQIGVKSNPGPLYGVSSHAWSALAVAVTAIAQMRDKQHQPA